MDTLLAMRTGYPLILLITLFLGGCASVDFDYPRESSQAVSPTRDGQLYRALKERVTAHPAESGFYLLDDGIEALSARLILAERAEYSIDVQYYLIKKDRIGYSFLDALLQAADRGVRVRILIDDIFTGGHDPGLSALHAHPNIEVRLFNPFAYRSARFMNALQFSRLNRRMHNKMFIVDNQIAILGGRNIAKEYFAARSDTNFGDLDVLMVGPVVAESSGMFDAYWNHRKAMPVSGLVDMPEDQGAATADFRGRMDEAVTRLKSTPYIEALRDTVDELREAKINIFTWSGYQLVYDSPDKAVRDLKDEADSIVPAIRDAAMGAQSELVVSSPYFIPTKATIENIRVLEQRGVDVVIITNSLASTNHAIVHSGYGPTRKRLLEAGARIFETKPDAHVSGANRAGLDADASTLHTKAFIVDRKKFFLGSFNWDPRSANINTELGVIMHSPELSQLTIERAETKRSFSTYELKLNAEGRLRWHENREGGVKVWNHEPETSWWRRFWVGFAGILPINSQL